MARKEFKRAIVAQKGGKIVGFYSSIRAITDHLIPEGNYHYLRIKFSKAKKVDGMEMVQYKGYTLVRGWVR